MSDEKMYLAGAVLFVSFGLWLALRGEGRGNFNGNCNPDATCNSPRLPCRQINNMTWNTWKCQP